MTKFRVYGVVPVSVCIEVEADDEDSAITAAYEQFDGLTGYCGNGGSDKLVGTTQSEVSIEPQDEFEFLSAEVSDE